MESRESSGIKRYEKELRAAARRVAKAESGRPLIEAMKSLNEASVDWYNHIPRDGQMKPLPSYAEAGSSS